MQIFLKTFNGKSLTFDVESSDTVESLKAKVQSREGIPPGFQGLVYSGKQMKDSRTLADNHVEKDNTLHLVMCLRMLRGSGQVFVWNSSGKTLTIHLDLGRHTVLDLKKEIEERLMIEPEAQRLTYWGKELEDAHLLKEYKVESGAALYVAARLQGRAQVFVRDSSVKTLTIDVDLERHTVLDVKKVIKERLKIEPEAQRLVCSGRKLNDARLLKEYKVANEATLHLVVRLPKKQ